MRFSITFRDKDGEDFMDPSDGVAVSMVAALESAASLLRNTQGNAHVIEVVVEEILEEEGDL